MVVADPRNPFNARPLVSPEDTKHHREFIVGVDIGQAHDPTALVLLERAGEWGETIHVRGVQRLPLGMPYPDQARRMATICQPLVTMAGAQGIVHMGVDATGVGRPVVDMLSPIMPCGISPIVITAGTVASRDERGWQRVPKRDLIATAQVALEQHVLMFAADLPELEVFTSELQAYRVTINADSGHDSYANSARENPHDDLVLALAVGVWCAYRHGWGREYPMHVGEPKRYLDGVLLDMDATGLLKQWAADMPKPAANPNRRVPLNREPLSGWWTER